MQQHALSIEEYEKLQPVTYLDEGGRKAAFYVPNSKTLWRAHSLRKKEPDTLAWIETFAAGEVMVDIGANVGMYSIWAAKMRDVRVFAFEPESQNYALLNRNIFINQLDGLVRAYPVALSDCEGFNDLFVGAFEMGGSCHSFGEKLNFKLEPMQSSFTQGSYATTLDRLVQQNIIPLPDYVKVDVDGIEHRVMKGCEGLLANPHLKSVLVELNTNLEVHRGLIDYIKGFGFGLCEQQLAIAMRTEGAFKGVGNHIFRRDLA